MTTAIHVLAAVATATAVASMIADSFPLGIAAGALAMTALVLEVLVTNQPEPLAPYRWEIEP